MADNFDMKKFLVENQLGAYSKLKEEVEEAKKEVSKEDKIAVIKEWIWYTCDEGTAKEDINKYNKMVDIYFTDKEDVTKEDFKKIWAKITEKYGVGDVGADWEAFPETWKDVQTGTLVNEGEAAYEYEKGKAAGEKEEKEKLAKEDYAGAEEEKMMDFLAEYEVIYVVQNGRCYRKDDEGNMDEVSMSKCRQYAEGKEEKEEPLKEDASAVMDILGFLAGLAGMGLTATQILSWQNKLEKENPELYKQLGQVSTTIGGADPSKNLEEKKEEIKEALSPEAFERMDGLVSQSDIMEYLRAAERIVNTLSDEGFEARDIFDYLYQIVINDL